MRWQPIAHRIHHCHHQRLRKTSIHARAVHANTRNTPYRLAERKPLTAEEHDMSTTDLPLANHKPGRVFTARELQPDEIITPDCKRLIDGDFIGVFSTGVPASESAVAVYKFVDVTAEGL
jgi:hypothetical protein